MIDLLDVAARAVATALQSFTAVLIGSGVGLLDAALWEQAAVAALGGVVTVVHRASTSYLAARGDEGVPL